MARPPTDARDRLLAAAARLFYAQGIAATGIDEILREAGVAKMTLYHHFGSKEGLALAFLEHRHTAWMARFHGALATAAPGLPGLADALEPWFQDGDFRGCAFLNTVCEGLSAPPLLTAARRHKEDLLALIRTRCPTGAESTLAEEALLVLDGAILRRQMTGDPGVLAHARRLLERLESSVSRRGGKPARLGG